MWIVACETPPAPAVAPPAPSVAVAPVSRAPVADVVTPVDAGAAPQVAGPSSPVSVCPQLDAAAAAAPATELEGIRRAVVITDVSEGWGDWEGGIGHSTLYPSGFYQYSNNHPMGSGSQKNGYYQITDRAALQAVFDEVAIDAALARALKQARAVVLLPGTSHSTTATIGTERIAIGMLVRKLPMRWLGAAEPEGLSKPGVVGHHVADLKVIHAWRYRALDCVTTFDHRQASMFAALLAGENLTLGDLTSMKPFLEDASSRLNPDFADARASLAKLIASAPPPGQTPGAASTAPAGVVVQPHPTGDVKLVGTTSTPPVSDAERVVAGLRSRFRACYMRGSPEDLKHAGKVHVRATLAPNGEVSSTAIVENQGFSAVIETCIKRVVNRSTFDAPGGTGATVDIPLMFVPATAP